MFRIPTRALERDDRREERGVPVRLITDPTEYRNPDRLWHSYNVDRMYAAGIPIKFINHFGGQPREARASQLAGDGDLRVVQLVESVGGLATRAQPVHDAPEPRGMAAGALGSKVGQRRAVSPKRKQFVPLPPSTPTLVSPSNGATGIATAISLKWYAGKWAHKYDVYLGTTRPPCHAVLTDRELGPSETTTDYKSLNVSGLAANTTYYWTVVSRTMANVTATSSTGSFTTGSSSTGGGPLPSGWSASDIGTWVRRGSASYCQRNVHGEGLGRRHLECGRRVPVRLQDAHG
jgi:hypothetical protein